MLLRVIGDPAVMERARVDPSRGIGWKIDENGALGELGQLSALCSQLNLPAAQRSGALPEGYILHRCDTRDAGAAELLRLDLTPQQNGLFANSYVWMSWRPVPASVPQPAARHAPGTLEHNWSPATALGGDVVTNSRSPQQGGGDGLRGLQLQLLEKQRTIEDLSRRLHQSQQRCQVLQQQLLDQSELLRQQRGRIAGGSPSAAAVPPAAVGRSGLTVLELEEELDRMQAAADQLESENAALRKEMSTAEDRAKSSEIRLEAVEAWRLQHDPAALAEQQKKGEAPAGSELRREVERMRGTLRDILPRREQVRGELDQERRTLQQRFGMQTAEQEHLLQEARDNISKTGAQLMPTPYYMDPHRAPASAYQVGGQEEGTVIQLRVKTLQGEGTVVRRLYSAVTRQNLRVLVLSSLDGVVTDEIVAEELTHAGIGYGTSDTLLLATRRHRWVLQMNNQELVRWLDFVCDSNPKLRPQNASHQAHASPYAAHHRHPDELLAARVAPQRRDAPAGLFLSDVSPG
eukprot:Hpha_TRINITY_DN26228_c0_g1::TRINITY_DN26228_c0_g1_i1::g.184742::m.184742